MNEIYSYKVSISRLSLHLFDYIVSIRYIYISLADHIPICDVT